MGSLQLLSALNWVFAVLYLVAFLFVLLMSSMAPSVPVLLLLGSGLVLALFAAPHVYLALNVERGRGRILQTVLAVFSLLNFPLGSAFGIFAIWAVWAGPSAPVFEDPSLADARHDDVQEADEGEGEADEDDGSESPYAYARRLRDEGMNARAIRARLDRRELADEEIETVLGALGLKVPPRAAPKPAAVPRTAAKPAATPRAAVKPAAAPRAAAKPATAPRASSPKPPPRGRS